MYLLNFLVILLLSACGGEDINTYDPSNLTVEITVSEDGSGIVQIQAIADNAIEYQLRVGTAVEPTASNATGEFDNTFIQPGNYQIEVRAYG